MGSEDQSDSGVEIRPAPRFKVVLKFSEKFQPVSASNDRGMTPRSAAEVQDGLRRPQRDEKIHHQVLDWISHQCKISIETTDQLEVALPIVVLTILDAVYGQRVKWTEVEWEVKYLGVTAKNYVVLQDLWKEVNMDSCPEFKRLPPCM